MIIYYLLFCYLLFFALIELSGIKICNIFKFITVFIVVLLSGLRDNIGTDFPSYVFIYEKSAGYVRVEPGFKFMVDVLNLAGCSQQMYFLITASISIIPVAFTIHKFYPQYFFTAISTYVFSFTYFEGMNTVRQAMAMGILFYSFCSYIYKPKTIKFILLGLLATSFHYSAFIIVILGWCLIEFSWGINNTFITFLILFFSFILGYFIKSFFEEIQFLSIVLGYQDYMDRFEQRGVSGGSFHFVLNFVAIALLLFTSQRMKKMSTTSLMYLKLFVWSIVIYNIFFNFYIGIRFYWYLFIFLAFVMPVILTQYKKKIRPALFIVLISVFTLYTIVTLIGSPEYNPYLYTLNIL